MQAAATNTGEPLASAVKSATSGRATLLFVDDEERILRSLRMLFALDFNVLVTTDAREALQILQRERVHVLISDQRMPIMPGVELLRQAREIAPDTMRLLLTGYADIEAIVGSINEGEVFRYLSKPWNADEIRTLVSEAASIAINLQQLVVNADARPSRVCKNILLVDESEDVANGLRCMLDEGFPGAFSLQWASSLDDAMDKLDRVKPAMVISEVTVEREDMMPFLKLLKRYHPHIVTIVLTTFKDTSLLVDLINQGQVHRFLPKPMRKSMMMRGIQSGMDLADEISLRPEIVQRHAVDVPAKPVDAGIVSRIRSLFKGIGAR